MAPATPAPPRPRFVCLRALLLLGAVAGLLFFGGNVGPALQPGARALAPVRAVLGATPPPLARGGALAGGGLPDGGAALTFFLVWTKGAADWNWLFNAVIAALLFHHPRAGVVMLSRELPLDFFACFAGLGFNISVVRYDFESIARGTPAEALVASGKVQGSMYRVAHESDVVRLLVLHRFGGTYVDTDMLFLRPLDDAVTARSGMGLETVAGANHEFHVPSSRRINNAILHAPAPRDPFVACMIGELGARYDPGVWACIGPDLVGECHDRLAAKAPLDAPALFPREWFYPLDWRFTWYVNLSNRSRWRLDSFWLPGERAATYGLHLYNSHSSAQLENHRKGGGYHNTGGPQAGSYLEEVLARVPLPPQCRAIELNTGPTLGPPRDGEEAF